MKILHVLDHSLPLQSGYTFRTWAILKQQQALGWETVQVTSAKQGKTSSSEETIEGFRFYRTLPGGKLAGRLSALTQLAVIRSLEHRLTDIIQREQPDLLHAHSPALNGVAALRAGRRAGLPVVYECRAFWEDAAVDHGTSRQRGLRYRLSRGLETYVFRRADAITTLCDGLRRDILARGIPPAKITIIPNGVDVERFSVETTRPDPAFAHSLGLDSGPILGFIGSFYAYEGLSLLLRAMPALLRAEPEVRLLLVGGGPEAERLQALARELDISSKVSLTGRVSHEDVERYYDLVDVLVYPRLPMRLTELVTPLKPLEAMARGRIVAASNVGGHRELIQDGKTGFLFSPDSPEALAEALLNIIRRRADWPEIRMVARQFVEQERTWARSVSSYRKVYDTVTARFRKIKTTQPQLLVVSTLFPHSGQPVAGVFIRERMFRVGKHLPLIIVAPTPWFPCQGLLRRLRPHFRPPAPRWEIQDGIEIYRPRFFSVPGFFKWLDGWSLALAALPTLRRLRHRFDLIDAHFAYPEGYAATLLGKWFGVPVTITLRGTEIPISRSPFRRRLMLKALESATRVFAVAASLERHVVGLGADPLKIRVVGNAVDTEKFHPVPQAEARRRLGLPADGPILISVGGLVERKGFHRVIELLPALRHQFPGLRYLIVGGPGPAGDMSQYLRQQVRMLKLEEAVHFLGVVSPEDLKWPLSAADVFVLATRSEGWANVLLEALACGLPVITTDVGGNREVISNPRLGTVVPFGDAKALESRLRDALTHPWDRAAIRAYACENHWDRRVEVLIEEFVALSTREGRREGVAAAPKEFRS